MDGDQKVKFLFSFYNLYLIGFSYDEIWRIFDDAMIEGISQEARDRFVKKLGFPGDYNTLRQNYLKLVIGFEGQCDTYNKIAGLRSGKTTEDELITALCRTTITLPESARFTFLMQFHLRSFHSGDFHVALDKLVLEGEEYTNFSLHLTKWGTYSTMTKKGKKFFDASVIPKSGIKSFSGLLNFISIATNKKYDEEKKALVDEVKKADNTTDGRTDDKGDSQRQNEENEESKDTNKNIADNGNTWFYQAPIMPYVPRGRQNLNLVREADVATYAMLEIDRKIPLEELSWTFLLQLAMRGACKCAEEKLSVKVDKLGKDPLINCAKPSMSLKLIHTDSDFYSNMVVEAVQAVKTTNTKREVKYPVKSISVLKAHGKSAKESCLLNGYALNSGRAAQGLPTRVIACLDFNLQEKKLQIGFEVLVSVSDPRELDKIRQREYNITKELIEKVLKVGANVVFTTKGSDDTLSKYFVEVGAMAVGCVRKDDSGHVAKTTGATTVSVVLRGANDFMLEEIEWPLHDPPFTVKKTLDSNMVVAGGGAIEAALSVCLENIAATLGYRERLANDFMLDETEPSPHDALLIVKRSLDSNMISAGGDAIEAASLGSMEQLAIGEFAGSLLITPKMYDKMMLEGPSERAKATLVECTSHPLCGPSNLAANLAVTDAKCGWIWNLEANLGVVV